MHNLPAVFTVLGLCLSALSLPFALHWIPPNHALVGIALVVLALNAGCAPGGGGNAGWTTAEDTLPNGVLRVINTPPASGAPVTLEADEEMRIGGGDLGGPASFGRIRQIAPLPDGRGPCRTPSGIPCLSLDDRGRLWVRLSSAGADTTAYDVFDPDGRHAETVVVHARVDSDSPPSLRGDTLWAVVRDELDVQYVIKARLNRPPTAADLDSSAARIRRTGTSAPAPASA